MMSINRLISGATVIDIHTGAKDRKDILIHGEKIVAIGLVGSLEVPDGTERVDASGKYVIPGLWDAHIHMTIWPEYTHELSTLLVANGITSVRDMGGKIEDVVALRDYNRRKDVVAPRMWIAGPIIDGAPHMVRSYGVEVNSPEEAVDLVDTLVEQGVDFIKLYEMLLPEVFSALVERAQHHYHLPAAGHIPQRMTISEVLEVGRYDVQHLGGTGSGMKYDCVLDHCPMPDRKTILDSKTSQESGLDLLMKVTGAAEITPDDMDPEKIAALIQLFVKEGTWHTPTLVAGVRFSDLGLTEDSFATDTVQYLPKARQQAAIDIQNPKDDPTNVYKFGPWSLQIVKQMHSAGVKLLAGTDSPPLHIPGFCLHLELKALVVAGLSPLEALQTATINPADFFNISQDIGSIDVGKYADLVLLDKDPLLDIENSRCISFVMSRGQLFNRRALDSMLSSISKQ